jgi:hypothetical protein
VVDSKNQKKSLGNLLCCSWNLAGVLRVIFTPTLQVCLTLHTVALPLACPIMTTLGSKLLHPERLALQCSRAWKRAEFYQEKSATS